MKLRLWFSAVILLVSSAAPSMAQYWSAMPPVDPKNVGFAGFSNDEKRVCFISKQGGTDNIWTVPVKGGQPTQVTKFAENGVVRAMHLMNRPYLVIERASSAAGDYHLYLIKDDGTGEAQDLTRTGPGVWNDIAGMSYNGRYVYYRSNNPNKDKVDVWRYDAQQYTTEDVFPNDKDYSILAWSRDHGKLLVTTPTTGELTMIDIVSTEHTSLMKPDVPFRTALWDPTNHAIFFIDATGALKIADMVTGSLLAAPDKAVSTGVEYFDFSPNGKYLVEKNTSGWHVLDAATRAAIELPSGAVPVAIAPRETQLLYTVGPKLYLFDIIKKSSTELATIE